MAKVLVKFKDVVRQEYLLTNPVTVIGRNQTNDIPIDNLAVSRVHCQIVREGNNFVVEDLNSNNGTFVNDNRIQKHTLKHGDNILVGKHILEYVATDSGKVSPLAAASSQGSDSNQDDLDMTFLMDSGGMNKVKAMQQKQTSAPPPTAATPTPAASTGASPRRQTPGSSPPAAPPPQKKPELPLATLTVLAGELERRAYDLTSPATPVGKGTEAEIRLSGFLTPSLAFIINRRPDGYFLTPGSGGWSKATINHEKLTDSCKLSEGDIIEIRSYRFRFGMKNS